MTPNYDAMLVCIDQMHAGPDPTFADPEEALRYWSHIAAEGHRLEQMVCDVRLRSERGYLRLLRKAAMEAHR